MIYNLNQIKTDRQTGLKLIIKQFNGYRWKLALLILLLTLTSAAGIATPLLVKYAIDNPIAKGDFAGLQRIVMILLGIIIASFGLRYFQMKETGVLGQKILFNLRDKLFRKLQELPLSFFSQNQSGDIIQRLTANVEGVNRFFSEGIMRLFGIVFSLLFEGGTMIVQDYRLGLIVIGGGLLIVIFLYFQGNILSKIVKNSLDVEGNNTGYIQEALNGFKAIQMNNQEGNWKSSYAGKNANFLSTRYRVTFLTSMSDTILGIIGYSTAVAVLILSLHFYSQGEITKGGVVLFLGLVVSFFRELNGISELWSAIQSGIASAQRIDEIFELENNVLEIENPYNPKEEDIRGDVEFKKVDFAYEDAPKVKVLEDIDFKVKAGQKVAIVGPTGAGKTTFVNTIARLYDVPGGEVLVDGINVRNWELDRLRSQIGYLIQDTFLFEDTILNNLRYNNPEVTEESAMQTFKYLGAEQFITSLPDGLNTKLEAKGGNISAGQRQIIALARVLLRNPKILILDEATSKIDTKSEKMIQNAIDQATKGKTSFIIAHRLSTIFNADLIILIQDNTILESGSHKELLERKGKYFEMYSKFIG